MKIIGEQMLIAILQERIKSKNARLVSNLAFLGEIFRQTGFLVQTNEKRCNT